MLTRRILPSLIAVVAALLISGSARVYAAGGYFGVQERIKCIQPVKEEPSSAPMTDSIYVPVKQTPKYSLCYKYSMTFFFAGVFLHDDGYVLAERDDAYQYVPLPQEKIAELQGKGIIPNPLPAYSIPLSQYIAGYSLWLILIISTAAVLFWTWFKKWWKKGKNCTKCGLSLIPEDFQKGRCGSCGEPVPAGATAPPE